MIGELVMLPVRLGVRVTRLWFRAVEETVSLTANTTGRVTRLVSSRGSGAKGVTAAPPPDSTTAPGPARAGSGERNGGGAGDADGAQAPWEPPTEVRDFAPPVTEPAPGPPLSAEPAHVSEEPELVEEFAEPGAEEGVGAEVQVDPPWDGYEQMNAKQVISRLAGASQAELATVELYERAHRRRHTILNAVDRELRHVDGSGSHTQERGRIDG